MRVNQLVFLTCVVSTWAHKDCNIQTNLIVEVAAKLQKKWVVILEDNWDAATHLPALARSLQQQHIYLSVSSTNQLFRWHESELSHWSKHQALVVHCVRHNSQIPLIKQLFRLTWLVVTSLDLDLRFDSKVVVVHPTIQEDLPRQLDEIQRPSLNVKGRDIWVQPFRPEKGTGSGIARVPTFVPSLWTAIAKSINATTRVTNGSEKFDFDINQTHFDPRGVILPASLSLFISLYYKEVYTEPTLDSYLKPLEPLVWLMTVLLLLCTALFTSLIRRCLRMKESHLSTTLLDALFIYLQQDSQSTVHCLSTSFIHILQLLFSFFLFNSYSAVFISFITVNLPLVPFTTLEGVLADGSYKIMALVGKALHYFESSRPGILRELYERQVLPRSEQPKTFSEAFIRVCSSKQPLITESAVPLMLANLKDAGNPCPISKQSVPLALLKMSFKMDHDSQFKETIRICMTKLIQGGAVGSIYMKKAVMKRDPLLDTAPSSIELVDVMSLFVIMTGGVVCALGVLLVERWYFERRGNKPKTRPISW